MEEAIAALSPDCSDADLATVIRGIHALPGVLDRAKAGTLLLTKLTTKREDGGMGLSSTLAKQVLQQLAVDAKVALYDCLNWLLGGEEQALVAPDLQVAIGKLFPSVQQRAVSGLPPATAVLHVREEWLAVAPTALHTWLLRRKMPHMLHEWHDAGYLRSNEPQKYTLRLRVKGNRYQFARIYMFEAEAIAVWKSLNEGSWEAALSG